MKPKNASFSFPVIENEQQAKAFYEAIIAQNVLGDIFINGAGAFRPGDTTAYPNAFAFDKKENCLSITFNIYGVDIVYQFYNVTEVFIWQGAVSLQADNLQIGEENEKYNRKIKFEIG